MAARIPKLEERFPVTRDDAGRRLCRWDQGVIPKGRRTFCSDNCVHEVSMRTNPGYLRALVWKRDKGVCAKCGCDTSLIERVASYAAESYRGIGKREVYYDWSHQAIWTLFVSMGFHHSRSVTLWEADHVVEVVRDGDSCLENMQTLCVPCHKAKTKQLAGDRARERRDAKRNLLTHDSSGPADKGDNNRTPEGCFVLTLN